MDVSVSYFSILGASTLMVISPFTLCVANRLSPTWLGTELMSICRAISVLVEQAKNTKAAATIKKAAAASDMLRRILDIDSLLCYFIVLTTVEADMPPQETV